MVSKLETHYEGREEFQLGRILYDQQEYGEAEEQLRQAVDEQERAHNRDDRALIDSKYLLGRILYKQQKYGEAERLLQQALDWLENTLGRDSQDTLQCRIFLINTFNHQQKYIEAEEQLRKVVDGQITDDTAAVNGKYLLGRILFDQRRYSEAEEQLRQAVDGQENILGRDHECTLLSKLWLGRTLYDQQKYSEAEELLIRAVDETEKTFGRDNEITLNSKYWLGRALYMQQKYSIAKEQLQQAVDGQEKRLGTNHRATLSSMYLLGLTLYDQQNYSEAKGLLRKVADWREKILGRDHEDTLSSKCLLGRILYKQQKYSEAEGLLQQVADGQEITLGRDHNETLYSKYMLGLALYDQQKYSKAENPLQQAAHGQERTLSKDHIHTLNSKYWLGLAFYNQKKYSEAKGQLQQAADGQEMTLGPGHEDTLYSKSWLGLARLFQQIHSEADGPHQQAPDVQERAPGKYPGDTLATIRSSQLVQQNPSLFSPTNKTTQQNLVERLNSFFSEAKDSREPYSDSELNEISSLLKHSNLEWSKVPRTYVVLRTIDHLGVLDDLINVGFSDYWFPVTERSLPGCLRPSVRAAFFNAQVLVLTKSIDLEKGDKGQHRYFKQGESVPYESMEFLGNGGFGQVDKVLSLISFREYARKRVLRSTVFRGRRLEDMKQFIAEIQVLKRLKHQHIVEFIGSYTDPKYIGLIMSPVAEMDLSAYLKRAKDSNLPELRTFFGCLATALEYLHEKKVRHKDIKPGNILVKGGNVLFADFGLSLDFIDASGSTTMSMVNGVTHRYCAPEVAQYQPRNTASDIWSLGVVFMEMIVVLKNRTAQYMDEFFSHHGSQQVFIRANPNALQDFFVELEGIGDVLDNRALSWTQQMLLVEQQLRPTASSLVASITDGENLSFCGICCVSEEEFFDSLDE